jgi:hypothetical protein
MVFVRRSCAADDREELSSNQRDISDPDDKLFHEITKLRLHGQEAEWRPAVCGETGRGHEFLQLLEFCENGLAVRHVIPPNKKRRKRPSWSPIQPNRSPGDDGAPRRQSKRKTRKAPAAREDGRRFAPPVNEHLSS